MRLAYALHVYKAQGLTADRALVLTGGWQTDRETSYVALTRAREQTSIYASREDLGHQGIDADAIGRLAERASKSNAQQASISREQAEPDREPSPFTRELRQPLDRDQPRERDLRTEAEPDRERGSFTEELRKALGRDQPRDRELDSREAAEPNREPGSFARELREALGRDQPREGEREDAPAAGSFVERLERVLEEQRGRDRDRANGFEM